MRAGKVMGPAVTAASAQERYRYDWAGFRCDLPAALLRIAGRWLTGTWDCVVLVRSRGVWRPARLSSAGPPPDDPGPRRVAPGLTAGLQWTGGRLQIRFRRDDEGPAAAPGSVAAPRSVALEQGWDNEGKLILRGRLPDGLAAVVTGVCQVRLRHTGGWDGHGVPAAVADGTFRAAVPVGAVDVFGVRQPLRDGRWAIALRAPDGPVDCRLSAVDSRRVTIGPKVYRCAAEGTGLRLVVNPVLGLVERGRIRRRLLRDIYYRVQRRLSAHREIPFSHFHRKQCGGQPRRVSPERPPPCATTKSIYVTY